MNNKGLMVGVRRFGRWSDPGSENLFAFVMHALRKPLSGLALFLACFFHPRRAFDKMARGSEHKSEIQADRRRSGAKNNHGGQTLPSVVPFSVQPV